MVFPHPLQAIFDGLSSLVTGILVSHAGQPTTGTSIVTSGFSSTSFNCNRLGLTSAVSNHNPEVTAEEPITNNSGYEKK